MNKPYHISDYYDSFKSHLVFSTSYLGLENYIADLAHHFRKTKYEGNVIIDLLLSNGKTRNRYIQIYFDGKNFDIEIAKSIKANKELQDKSLCYYAENSELLKDSVLNKSQAYLIKNRIAI
ncbi:type II toxin-antitoxin system RnlB family antitoxin [Maribacter sp. MAR_2009_72]|uniref:type II toxin-antitoxin system RnlB family antitoxin n=1 Tax=Maribacter sp. MAR_2009_72 TaxID=1250050 RepID=UPI00119B110C|nr:type II toxin-antitoxin system RnlB family antitoxin [Maribacter sp. MAR_2009_72]TVZ14340.1 RnlB antitoxin of RnlAB toxin-antitoxin system [Maribacter sp. MAR_2009_72]